MKNNDYLLFIRKADFIQKRYKQSSDEHKLKMFNLLFKDDICPKCKSNAVSDCKGSTNIKPIKNINYICIDCLFEW